jgi:hypothetical protein
MKNIPSFLIQNEKQTDELSRKYNVEQLFDFGSVCTDKFEWAMILNINF